MRVLAIVNSYQISMYFVSFTVTATSPALRNYLKLTYYININYRTGFARQSSNVKHIRVGQGTWKSQPMQWKCSNSLSQIREASTERRQSAVQKLKREAGFQKPVLSTLVWGQPLVASSFFCCDRHNLTNEIILGVSDWLQLAKNYTMMHVKVTCHSDLLLSIRF